MGQKSELKALVMAGAKKRWGEFPVSTLERLNFEIETFAKSNALGYMLMCADIVKAIKDAGGYIGPGRGPAVGSAVCYALGVTNVDPIEYDLLFDRFMRPDRIMMPQVLIDTDGIGERAGKKLLFEKYGPVEETSFRTEIAWPCTYKLPDDSYFGITAMPEVEMIKTTLDLVRERGEEMFDLASLRDDEWETLKLFWRGETDGIPFFDSPNMKRALIGALGPRFKDLVALFALSKPGLDDYREKFLSARMQGGKYAHPLLKDVLAETYGVLIYQEQLMLAVRKLAGFTRFEADMLRVGFGRRKLDVVERMEPKFIEGCLANPEFRTGEYADESKARECAKLLWNEFFHAGAVLWQKAHCVAWTTLAYQLAYLKVHYPSEWTYALNKCKRKQLTVLDNGKRGNAMTFHDIEMAVEDGCRVTILIRHAERPPLDPSDTSFGERLSITDRGWSQARRFGMLLSSAVDPKAVSLYASGTFRTIQTARGIGEGLFEEAEERTIPPVEIWEFLGSDSPYFGSAEDRLELIGRGNYLASLNDYFRTGEQFGYRPLGLATGQMLDGLRSLYGNAKGVTVAVTHDINVASFMAGTWLCREFTPELWPSYMDAVVITESPHGEIKYGVMRYDTSHDGIDL